MNKKILSAEYMCRPKCVTTNLRNRLIGIRNIDAAIPRRNDPCRISMNSGLF